jgi:hypothetical protein
MKILHGACAWILWLAGLMSSSGDSATNALVDACVSLGAPVWTNGQVQLTLSGESGVSYVLQASPDGRHWAPVMTNSDYSITRVFRLATPGPVAFYRTARAPLPVFAYAVAAQYGIRFNGHGLVTDSFNSAATNLSTDGHYDPDRTSTNGHVASLFGPVDLGNHVVGGDLFLGPTVMADANWSQVLGTIHTDFNACFPEVVPPAFQTGTPGPMQNVTIDGTRYDYVFLGPTNDYTMTASAGAIYVAPNAKVRLLVTTTSFAPGFIRIAGQTNQAGSLTIYQLAGNATVADSVVESGNPASFAYFGSVGVTSVSLMGTTNFTGTLYAPSATVALNGGASCFDFVGSCICRSLSMNSSSCQFHFDENLLRAGPVR